MADEPQTSPPPSPVRTFARDVLVNVLANLVAAAVIYLGAVLGGYVRANRSVVTVALLIMCMAASTALWAMATYLGLSKDPEKRRRSDLFVYATLALSAVATLVYGLRDVIW